MIARAAMILAALGLLASAPVAQAEEPLTVREILRLFPGTFRAVVRGKYTLKVTVSRDGVIVGEVPGLQDEGRWTVRGNQLCIVMPAMTRGRVECSVVVADGSWYRGRNVVFQPL